MKLPLRLCCEKSSSGICFMICFKSGNLLLGHPVYVLRFDAFALSEKKSSEFRGYAPGYGQNAKVVQKREEQV